MRLVQILQLLVLETRIEWERCDSPTQMLNPFLDFFRRHREVFFSHLHWDKPKMKEFTPSRHSETKGREAHTPTPPCLRKLSFACLTQAGKQHLCLHHPSRQMQFPPGNQRFPVNPSPGGLLVSFTLVLVKKGRALNRNRAQRVRPKGDLVWL